MTIRLYLTALISFFALDMIWLGAVARSFYRSQIGFMLNEGVNWPAAVIFYLLFVFGLVYFVIVPGVQRKSLVSVAADGALFGLVTYAAYDLTNLATTKNWPLSVTLVDLAWGAVLGAAVSAITYALRKKNYPGETRS